MLTVFGALATRNTVGTLMNDSSSRSNCFAWLNLYIYNKKTEKVRKIRFQFCDLAGSERMVNAHGKMSWKENGIEGMNGLF